MAPALVEEPRGHDRATAKLLKRAKVPVAPDAEASTTKLGDWYVNVISYGRQRRILCVSERTLLPVLVAGAGLGRVPAGLLSGLDEVLVALGVSRLAKTPCGPLRMDSPDRVTLAAFAASGA